MIKVKEAVQKLEAYHPPLEMRVEKDYLLLDFNESTIPPHQGVTNALKDYLDAGKLRMYPTYGGFLDLLSAYTGIDQEQLILTNGSDSAIQIITQALLGPGDEMIMPAPGFSVIESSALAQGAKVISPPYRGPGMAFPQEEVLAAITPRTRLVVVIHPNNPTGTSPSLDQIEALLQAHPEIPVMVDEAYYEFTGVTAAGLLARHDNLVVIRTFSKAFAIAGLRLGYALSNKAFIKELSKLRIPYDVNAMAVVAGQALLENPAPWKAYVTEVMTRAKPMVERFFDEHGVDYVPGLANFMLVRPDNAGRAFDYLRDNGILVRPQRGAVSDCFRLSVGTMEEMRKFMLVYAEYLTGGEAKSQRGLAD